MRPTPRTIAISLVQSEEKARFVGNLTQNCLLPVILQKPCLYRLRTPHFLNLQRNHQFIRKVPRISVSFLVYPLFLQFQHLFQQIQHTDAQIDLDSGLVD